MSVIKWFVLVGCCVFWLPMQADGHEKTGHEKSSFELTVINAYMPAVPPVSRTAAVYLKLKNTSQSKVVLSDVSTSIAKHTMFHQTIESDGLVKMKHLSNIEILPGETIEFSPGGMHIMLMGIQVPSYQGSFKLNLIFENQTSQTIEVDVRSMAHQ